MPYLAKLEDVQTSSQNMCVGHLHNAKPGSVTLVLLSGLTDAYQLVKQNPDLVKAKIARVALMSGVQVAHFLKTN